jgi:hypothetical protein
MARMRPIDLRLVLACLVLVVGALAMPASSLALPGGQGPAARSKPKPKKRRCRPVRRHRHASRHRHAHRRRCRRKPHRPPPREEPPPNTPPTDPPHEEQGGGGEDGGGGGPGPELETVDLISDPGFEDPGQPQSGCFRAAYGTLALDTASPIAEAQSLSASISNFGSVSCEHAYGPESGPIGKSVEIRAKVRIDTPTAAGTALAVCAMVYFEETQEPAKKCVSVPSGSAAAQSVAVSQDAEGKRLARVFLQLEAGSTAIGATLDDAHLVVEQVKGSEGPRGGGGGGGGGGGSNVGRYAAMVSPTDGETFGSPLSLRLVGIGHDPNVFTNQDEDDKEKEDPGHGTNATKVEFFLDGTKIFEQKGREAEYHVFKGFAQSLDAEPGEHEVWAVATYKEPTEQIKSKVVTIAVEPPPAYAETVNLTQNVVLGTNDSYELVGSAAPGGRIRLNGNGHKIVAPNGTSGQIRLKDVDVYGLGSSTETEEPGIDVTMTGSGSVEIEGSTFDSANQLALTFNGSSTAQVRGNLFRSNMRVPIGQEPGHDPNGVSSTVPLIHADGSSTAAKVFAANNVGAAPVLFERTHNWTIGGATDADSNVLIGPRAAVEVIECTNVLVEGNFIDHNYYGGWSQGQLLELNDSHPITVEHNVLMDSSWPVRGISGDSDANPGIFAYNLLLEAGHEWMVPGDHAYIHHNVFVGGENDNAGIIQYYDNADRIENNTFDGMLDPLAHAAIIWQRGQTTLDSNAFLNWPTWTVGTVESLGGTIAADYNGFFNPQTGNYVSTPPGAHDLGGGASTDPKFAGPLPTKSPFDMDKVAVWKRALKVSEILAAYRARYTPTQGSPYIDAGDPAGGAGNDIGAVGAGAVGAGDLFGSFSQPGWTPPR